MYELFFFVEFNKSRESKLSSNEGMRLSNIWSLMNYYYCIWYQPSNRNIFTFFITDEMIHFFFLTSQMNRRAVATAYNFTIITFVIPDTYHQIHTKLDNEFILKEMTSVKRILMLTMLNICYYSLSSPLATIRSNSSSDTSAIANWTISFGCVTGGINGATEGSSFGGVAGISSGVFGSGPERSSLIFCRRLYMLVDLFGCTCTRISTRYEAVLVRMNNIYTVDSCLKMARNRHWNVVSNWKIESNERWRNRLLENLLSMREINLPFLRTFTHDRNSSIFFGESENSVMERCRTINDDDNWLPHSNVWYSGFYSRIEVNHSDIHHGCEHLTHRHCGKN